MTCAAALTIAISTLGTRLPGLVLPPPVTNVSFLVLVQKHDGSNPWQDRPDVTVVTLHTVGLSHSRNAALDQASGSLLLFSDDDIALKMAGILALKRQLEQSPDLALIRGWRAEHLGQQSQSRRAQRLSLLNAGRVCAPELMIRTAPFRAAALRFDPRFGLGGRHGLGEEFIFVTDALKAGLRGLTVPVVTGSHPGASTGDHWQDPALIYARQMVLQRVFGRWAPVARLGYGIRHRRRFPDRAAWWRFLLGVPHWGVPARSEHINDAL